MVADVADDEFVREIGSGRAASTTTGRHLERRIATDGAGGTVESLGPPPSPTSIRPRSSRASLRSLRQRTRPLTDARGLRHRRRRWPDDNSIDGLFPFSRPPSSEIILKGKKEIKKTTR